MRQDRRGSWYLLTGMVLGVAIGLIYSWVISPVEYVDAPPYALRVDFKDEYRALVAAAYLYSSDLLRAEDRLAQLKDDDMLQSLSMQAQRALAEGHPEGEVKALGLLAVALERGLTPPGLVATPTSPPTVLTPGSVKESPTLSAAPQENPLTSTTSIPNQDGSQVTLQPVDTVQPIPMPSETPTQAAPFLLGEQRLVCNPNHTEPLLQVEVQDSDGQPVPGIELVVQWNGDEDRFFTGLKPELGLGYADFTMTPLEVYTLSLVDHAVRVDDISAAECLAEDGNRFWGSWMLTFVQP